MGHPLLQSAQHCTTETRKTPNQNRPGYTTPMSHLTPGWRYSKDM